ncbi:family 20 glycosylhydrolase [Pedobacter sp. PLR]|uniref:beta-N-acetylhexosaminidase n=1 Tax=Pedobacter sp. PLR TaxID=2994465 RepID=UPI0022475070|nr:family 20 glycosylhydrolase [Pedobacter sp. PLR]
MAQSTSVSVIPEPVSIKIEKGKFIIDAKTVISVKPNSLPEVKELATTLSLWLANSTGLNLKMKPKTSGSDKSIRLEINSSLKDLKGDEGYKLRVTSTEITLQALKPSGIFYGLQTINQLLSVESVKGKPTQWSIPAVQITDYPRLGWRGLMLDVSRHFFSKEFIKSYIDQMARYKFNVFHWHLTDDQGWRIEIKAFPKLTEVGAWRVPRIGQWWSYEQPQQGEAATYGGFYTQDDIREIVAYARQRTISILPEIDVPGHSLAAIAAYPYLSATGEIYQVNPGSKFYEIQDNTLNPADERVYDFLDKVLGEVAALFPNEYIHIGGDECTKVFWHKSAPVQAFMVQNGLKTEDELQSYFIKRVEKILQKKGKRLIGWDEILEGGLAPDATVMSWRGMQGGIKAAQEGHQVIMTPADNTYLDLYQGDPALEPDTYSMLRLKTAYQWDPLPPNIKQELVLGGQGNLWTESVSTNRHAEYMTWPRSMALAEVFWSPKAKQNWSNFQRKLASGFKHLDAERINYSKAAFDVVVSTSLNDKNELIASLSTDLDDLIIYYTLDNTNPDSFSNKYTGEPIQIPAGIYQLRAVAYQKNNPIGKTLIINRKDLEKRAEK